jgi:hypothetical protein
MPNSCWPCIWPLRLFLHEVCFGFGFVIGGPVCLLMSLLLLLLPTAVCSLPGPPHGDAQLVHRDARLDAAALLDALAAVLRRRV